MSGLDPRQLRDLIVRPSLKIMGLPTDERVERLVMGTAVHESMGLRYLHQLGRGPALGLWGIEPATARDTVERSSEAVRMKLLALTAVTPWAEPGSPLADQVIDQLCGNLYLGAGLCRAIYYLKPFRLEELGNGEPEKLARVWKLQWNSLDGEGTEAKFLANWHAYLGGLYPA